MHAVSVYSGQLEIGDDIYRRKQIWLGMTTTYKFCINSHLMNTSKQQVDVNALL